MKKCSSCAILSLLLMMMQLLHHPASAQEDQTMALIPAGSYLPLYSGNKTTRVPAFLIDRLPVTNANFSRFIADNPQWSRKNVKRLFADAGYLRHWKDDGTFVPGIAGSAVVNVSWFAAQEYCECQGKRLPTTAEWERVAEAGRTRPDGRNEEGFYALILELISKPSQSQLPEAGTTLKNYYGVWDLTGVTWEWTRDFNSALSTGESRGNSSLDNTLFCGGGSSQSGDTGNYAAFLRYAMRSGLRACNVVQSLGFRCAKDVARQTGSYHKP